MDAKELLEYVWEHPPEPFHGGCVKRALNPLLKSMRIFGGYHECNYYDSWHKNDRTEEKKKHRTATEPKQHHVTHNNVTQEGQIFQNGNPDKNSTKTILVKRNPKISAISMAHSDSSQSPSSHGGHMFLVEEAEKQNAPSLSHNENKTGERFISEPRTNESILKKCGIVNTKTTCKIARSLGYGDMLKGKDDVNSGKMETPSKVSCRRALLSDRTWCALVVLLLWVNVFR
ncbi:uncharacterized protein LOC106012788 isoform X2 [Aplysia californica]|nr:uncharacterized protein LOC106012788 isoform X2 [Aplysia californica]XP_035827666.1 uncharacterized protein LOC106012788 isoform X2 [Aplysia californica]XP_035827667.1 uncharacterized protein LOC106012788 isoform X2 [Aplysia californica]